MSVLSERAAQVPDAGSVPGTEAPGSVEKVPVAGEIRKRTRRVSRISTGWDELNEDVVRSEILGYAALKTGRKYTAVDPSVLSHLAATVRNCYRAIVDNHHGLRKGSVIQCLSPRTK